MTVQWYGEELGRLIEKEGRHNLESVANLAVSQIKETIRVPYPPSSDPGWPPRLRSGALEAGVGWQWVGEIIKVGVDAYYGIFLELGTSRMAARPFLLPAIYRLQSKIESSPDTVFRTLERGNPCRSPFHSNS